MKKKLRKVLIWLKERVFLLLLAATGIVYFTYTDNWTAFAKPFDRFEKLCNGLFEEKNEKPENDEEKENTVSGNSVQQAEDKENTVSGNLVSGNDVSVSGNETGGENPGQLPGEEPEVLYEQVEEDYFADALFIGDSRTVGLYQYGGLEDNAVFYASTGLTIYKLLDAEIVEKEGQRDKLTIEEALQENSFSKIYLMIGINEMGTGTVESFMVKYQEVLERIRQLQPKATIYLQSIMKVTAQRSAQGDYINNEGIEARNTEIEKLADNEKIYYLDVNSVVCDEGGGLNGDYTYDGVHLKAQYVDVWKEYLMTHAVKNELRNGE